MAKAKETMPETSAQRKARSRERKARSRANKSAEEKNAERVANMLNMRMIRALKKLQEGTECLKRFIDKDDLSMVDARVLHFEDSLLHMGSAQVVNADKDQPDVVGGDNPTGNGAGKGEDCPLANSNDNETRPTAIADDKAEAFLDSLLADDELMNATVSLSYDNIIREKNSRTKSLFSKKDLEKHHMKVATFERKIVLELYAKTMTKKKMMKTKTEKETENDFTASVDTNDDTSDDTVNKLMGMAMDDFNWRATDVDEPWNVMDLNTAGELV